MPEGHGTDRMHERLSSLEQTTTQHQRELQQLTINITNLAATVKDSHNQTIEGMKDMRSEVLKLYTEQRKDLDEIRTKKAPWGVIGSYVAIALMLGGFFWGEIKLDIANIEQDVEKIMTTIWTKTDQKEARAHDRAEFLREIEELRTWQRNQDDRIRENEQLH